MKISVAYSNSASIPTGVQYEQQKPFYSLSWEVELPAGISKQDMSKELIAQMKAIIDPLLLKDLKEQTSIRLKCTCKPTWNNQEKKFIHDATCLMGTAVKNA